MLRQLICSICTAKNAVLLLAAFALVAGTRIGWLDLDVMSALPLFLVGSVAFADIASTAMADVQETFKRVYLMAVDAVPDSNVLTAQFARTRKFKAGPDFLYFNVKLELGGSIANVPDAIKLPRAAHPKRKQGRCGIAHTYTVIAVGGQSIPLTEDNKQAFVENLKDQFDDAMVRMKNDVERQHNLDSRGILAILLTVAGAPTYGVEKAGGFTNGGPGTMYLIEDMDVCFINPGTGLERVTRAKISSVDYDANTVTLSASPTGGAIGDYLVLCNDNTATGTDAVDNYNNESIGVMTISSDTGTFENINRATFKRWKSVVMSNSGTARPISERLIATMDARIRARSGRKPEAYYTSPGISIELQDQLSTMRRFEGEKTQMKGGYEGLKIKNRTVIEGDQAVKGRFHGVNFDNSAVGSLDLVKMGFVDLDGARLHRIEGRHAYRAELWFPHNNIAFLPSTWGHISDLQDDLTIVR